MGSKSSKPSTLPEDNILRNNQSETNTIVENAINSRDNSIVKDNSIMIDHSDDRDDSIEFVTEESETIILVFFC